jgi:hypothetical protein
MSRYAQSIGVLELDVDGVKSDLHPTTDDIRKFRELLFDKKYKNDQSTMYRGIEDLVVSLIKKDYPVADSQEEKDLIKHVALNFMTYYKKLMVAFKFTTEEKLKESEELAKVQVAENIKNLTGSN